MGRGCCILIVLVLLAPLARAGEGKVRFNRDVRPILTENCLACHGPDGNQRKADLRLDTKAGLLTEIDPQTIVVVPGRPEQSELYRRIAAEDEHELMPPRKSNKKLSAEQKELIKRWIEEGAEWEGHWAFDKPTRPAVPEVKQTDWGKNEIDRFVLARLEREGLKPAPAAHRETLIRRVTFDLTGLPPTIGEVRAFLADEAPDAYEKLVDRLMKSPHYGEHRARYWLDAARYGDTHGIHHDNYREMWPYRDWVIDAFNKNMPFDQFMVEQLAGDLLPGATLSQQIASGFNRCNITTAEGGSINEEVLAMYAKDRVETTATVFLGMTAGCAVCHDHKFDPISQKEFYQLVAFFRNTTQQAMDGNRKDTPPVIVVPQGEDKEKWAALEAEEKKLRERLQQCRAERAAAFEAWLKRWVNPASPQRNLLPVDPTAQHVALALNEGEGDPHVTVDGWRRPTTMPADAKWDAGPGKEKGLRFGENSKIELPSIGRIDADAPFSMSAWVFVPPANGSFVIASKAEQGEKDVKRGWVLEVVNKVLAFRMIGDSPEDKLEVRAGGAALAGGKWNHVAVTYDGSRKAEGLVLFVNGSPQYAGEEDATLKGSVDVAAAPLRIGSDGKRNLKDGALHDFRIYRRRLLNDELQVLAKWNELQQKEKNLTDADKQSLQLVYLNRFDAAHRRAAAQLDMVEREQAFIRRRSPVTHIMQERKDSEPKAHVLFRGAYDQPREQVEPGTPAVLHAYPADAPKDRLGLARWMVDRENPLTARVTVNRLWQEMFGQGLVRTSEDFGVMGENPSHPELLDWLAVEFVESGWDVKRLVRLIMTSATYRQSNQVTEEKLAKDGDNRLLSRGARFRMDGEVLRDSALASSGLLVRKIGGPSVKPYQPPGVWEAVAMLGSDTRFYKQDSGEKLYRRSLYTFWKRSAPPASMEIFNAPSREVCTVRRERTNTPIQALVTMNDPQWVEAARHLAQRAIAEGSFDARLNLVTMSVLSRAFDERERSVCRQSLEQFLAGYRADVEAAKKLVAVGESKADEKIDQAELAAWTMLASQIMNLDEAVNK